MTDNVSWRVRIDGSVKNACGRPVHNGPGTHYHAVERMMPGYETRGPVSLLEGPFADGPNGECATLKIRARKPRAQRA